MSKEPRKAKDLAQRTFINGISGILVGVFIFLAEIRPLRWIFAAAIAALAATAIWEYNQLVKKKGLNPASYLSMSAAVLYAFMVFIKTQSPYAFLTMLWPYAPEMVLALAFFACFTHYALTAQSPLLNISSTFFGIVYVAIPLGLFIHIMFFFTYGGMQDPHLQGSWWIIYLIGVTKSADIGGYFIGSYFGKRKLAHRWSPNKTLEGAIGGLLASVSVSLFICFLGKRIGEVFEGFSYIQSIWLGALIGVFGQIGDLAESLLKRDAGVKDSNRIPGVGGILDMVDSLLFSSPFLYFFLRIVYI